VTVSPDVLERFDASFDPDDPERHAKVIGCGEISVVLALPGADDVVIKRMVGFRRDAEIVAYREVVARYLALLKERGVDVVDTQLTPVGRVVYLTQPRLAGGTIGNAVLRDAPDGELRAFLRAVLTHVSAVLKPGDAGLDAQLSNWSWSGGKARLLDVSTPILAKDGMDPAIVLRSMPAPLAWGFRLVALPSLLERYQKPRLVALDIAANFIKEGRADRIPLVLEEIASWGERLTEKDVRSYYRSDARLWTAFQAVRRAHRRWKRMFGGRYEYVLPDRIQRA
jgi:hypothetical protein